jgi:hypothetical protein
MAKEEKAKVKMTVIHFETESDNTTLQENIRAIAHTLTRALSQPQRIIYSNSQIPPGDGTGIASENEMETEQEDLAPDALTQVSGQASSKKKTRWSIRTPQPIDLDLTSGDMPIKAFLEQKNPETDFDRYLAITFWLKKYKGINEVNADHLYTCYRFMEWQVPKDPTAPFRNMKKPQYGWVGSGSEKATYVINHIGENKVEQMGR